MSTWTAPIFTARGQGARNKRASGLTKADLKIALRDSEHNLKGPDLPALRVLYDGSEWEIASQQDNFANVEITAYKMGGIVLFGLNTQPQMNTAERYWRAGNEAFRKEGIKTRVTCGAPAGRTAAQPQRL